MTHEICDQCETVGYCMKFGCIPLQPQAQKPCRSPYCECVPGTCSHPGCYDARSEPFEHPAPVEGLVAWVDALFDAIKHGDQDHQNWLQEKLKSWVISNPPSLQPAPVEKPAARKENYSDDTRYGTGGSYAQGGCYGPAAFTDGDHDGY